MKTFATAVTIVMMLIIALGLTGLTSPIPDSFAQGNATGSNETSGANNTALSEQSNASDTGSVSGYQR
jgi:hypothetical protein